MSSRIRRALFTAIALLLPVLVLETGLQLFYYKSSGGGWLFTRVAEAIYEPDAIRGYRVNGHLAYRRVTSEFDTMVYTDGHGMRCAGRCADVPYERTPGVRRVLFLGPSFSFGTASNYEDMYTTLALEDVRRSGVSIDAVNLGTPSQPVLPQLNWCRVEGWKYAPDAIVQTVFGSVFLNDAPPRPPVPSIPEQLAAFESPLVVRDGYLVPKTATMRGRFIAAAKNSATVFYGFNLLTTSVPDRIQGAGRELKNVRRLSSDSPEVAATVAEYRRYLDFIATTFPGDPDVVFLYFPLGYIVHPEDRARWRHLGLKDSETDLHNSKTIIEALRGAGIRVADATDLLIARGKTERMYNRMDIHFTKAGNRVVASVLRGALAFTK